VLDTGSAIDMVALAWLQTGSPTLQTMGSIGVMLMAGMLLLLVGLMVVAVWQGGATSVVEQVSPGSQSSMSDSVEERPDTADPGGGQSGTTSTVEDEAEVVELTDEEVILDILKDNDGRMKQARIVDETGWSKSKVSMLLSEMEDDGDITKLRMGRENIISLSGNEPDAAGSPFDSQ